MLFNSFHFALFFAIFYPLFLTVRKNVRARNILLLVASLYFYGSWNYKFLSLLGISTVVDYFVAVSLERTTHLTRRRLLMSLSVVTNMGMLGFFKYYNFFAESFVRLIEQLGFHPSFHLIHVLLPVGISFYSFQTLSYTIDVYRGTLKAEPRFVDFALFVAFFPHLVAGPIVRPTILLPQIKTVRPIGWPRFYNGVYLVGGGLFKKVVIADNLAEIANHVFTHAGVPSATMALVGVYAFALQIYCDFSGYADIARGIAKMMGFELTLNFNLPYFAVNPSDFWQRWHISLSTWLRDYLYVPLGGNRRGPRRTYINLMLTMLLGGLWHGAAWTFVFWGFYHGALLIMHRLLEPFLNRWFAPKTAIGQATWRLVRIVVFFHLVCLGWVFFRADSMTSAFTILKSIATLGAHATYFLDRERLVVLAAGATMLFSFQFAQWITRDLNVMFRFPTAVRMVLYALGVLIFLAFGEFHGQQFIYFQF